MTIQPYGNQKGKPKSASWRAASEKHWNDPAWRQRQREKWLERLPTINVGPAANSPLERILHRALLKSGISFSTQRRKLGRYVVDILIDQAPVIIEADGNVHILNATKDAERDAALRAAGYTVYRFTGRAINDDPDGCIRQVIEGSGLTPDAEPRADIRTAMRGPDHPTWRGGKRTYVCDGCGREYQAWPSTRQKPGRSAVQFCSQECQSRWQRTTGASVANRRSNSEAMKRHWADPEWRARQSAHVAAGRWPRQMVIQSEPVGDGGS